MASQRGGAICDILGAIGSGSLKRSALHPVFLLRSALLCVRSYPATLLPFVLVALLMALLAGLGFAEGLTSVALSCALSWQASAWAAQAFAAGAWQSSGGQPVPLTAVWRSGLKLQMPVLVASMWLMLLMVLGIIGMIVGSLLGVGLGMWVLAVAALEGLKGRKMVDRAWQLSGLSGIAWAVAITAVSLLVASYLILALQQLMGPSAALLYPPLTMMIALPLMMAALLERRSASPIA